EFWWFCRATDPKGRIGHLVRFYTALGLAMLAKGPMPLVVVVIPLGMWWWCHQPGEIITRRGVTSIPFALRHAARMIWPRTRLALTRMGLWWGIPLFLLMFVPWMIAVSERVPYFWPLWKYEYLDRVTGDYPGAKGDGVFYYVPRALGLMLPWALS